MLAVSGNCVDELNIYSARPNVTVPSPPVLPLSPGDLPAGVNEIQTEGTAFGSGSLAGYCSDVGAGLAGRGATGIHCWENINDGRAGNSNSWIVGQANDVAGVKFSSLRTISAISIARDSTGSYTDRSGGDFYVEYTTSGSSDASPWSTTDGWTSLGPFSGWAATSENYYVFKTPVAADALRIKLAVGGNCVDELRIYEPVA